MTKDEALKLALEALEFMNHVDSIFEGEFNFQINAIKEALANDTSQERVAKTSKSVHEPVGWISATELLVMRGNALGGAKDWRVNLGLVKQDGDVGLYTTPPQRKPLTDEEIRKANHHMVEGAYDYSFKQGVKWAEYKHGIKGEA